MSTPQEIKTRMRAEMRKLRDSPVDRNGHPVAPPATAPATDAPAATPEQELADAQAELVEARAALAALADANENGGSTQ